LARRRDEVSEKDKSKNSESDPAQEDELERIRLKKMKEMVSKASQKSTAKGYPVEPVIVSDKSFDEFVHQYPLVVVDCWAVWCGPCRMLAPTIDSLAKDYSGRIVFGKLDIDENPRTASRFGVQNIPTLLIMKNGVEVDRIVGAYPRQYVESKLKAHL
jgi:thioredoxin 1